MKFPLSVWFGRACAGFYCASLICWLGRVSYRIPRKWRKVEQWLPTVHWLGCI